MDTVLGTALTRTSDDRWGISILEQLYKRRRLLILDKLAGATDARDRHAGGDHRPSARK
jgi:hypothetical protein